MDAAQPTSTPFRRKNVVTSVREQRSARRPLRHVIVSSLVTAIALFTGTPDATPAAPALPSADALNADFTKSIHPFLEKYCVSCHNPEKRKGDFDLTPYKALNTVATDCNRWEQVRERLESGE